MNNDITSGTQVPGPTDIFCLKCGRYHQSVTCCPESSKPTPTDKARELALELHKISDTVFRESMAGYKGSLDNIIGEIREKTREEWVVLISSALTKAREEGAKYIESQESLINTLNGRLNEIEAENRMLKSEMRG